MPDGWGTSYTGNRGPMKLGLCTVHWLIVTAGYKTPASTQFMCFILESCLQETLMWRIISTFKGGEGKYVIVFVHRSELKGPAGMQ